ncbi:hypothetical protein LTR37_014664 [Vermiconidia calcicola]|uniref:Uncharacterized protein n=1 Tax=Vermiconidia calcicola TaxID=1690605 RepID=A0ACC3MSW9_9PEZI|nr:hypothetical protein LTR37_014664 [Vermiconidia calcicola]
MTTTIQRKPWDFSHVLDLVNSLSYKDSSVQYGSTDGNTKHQEYAVKEPERCDNDIDVKDFATQTSALGDFSRVFQFLGTPATSPVPVRAIHSPQSHESEHTFFTTKDDYASDGATFIKTQSQAALDDTADQATDTVSDSSIVPETPSLTRTQRKKKNRRERKAKEAAIVAEQEAKKAPASVSESEADIVSRKTPAKKASAHAVSTTPKRLYELRERDASGRAITASDSDPLLAAARVAAQKLESAKQANLNDPTAQSHDVKQSGQPAPYVQNVLPRQHSHPAPPKPQLNGYFAHIAQPPRQWPPSTPQANGVTKFVPATVQPHKQSAPKPSPKQSNAPPSKNTVPPKAPAVIQPMTVRSGEDRHWALLIKLIRDFFGDRKHLISPMNLTTHNNDPNGIHVFVDASNIFIGFNEQLKRSRGISPWIQVPSVDLSFDALALLMERRRPVAKRVLAGSTPHLPAFDKAKAVGYECSVLEKVYKARELTERQLFFKEHDRVGVRKRAKAPPANTVATVKGVGSGSGSETNSPQYAPARMIEQGVDEILHLKILESVIDAEKPSTIILATGDAAQAEYSQGFMAMAERALKKGWTVELVSWSKNISAMYTRKGWTDAWGDRFRIITLDDYAEELLDM